MLQLSQNIIPQFLTATCSELLRILFYSEQLLQVLIIMVYVATGMNFQCLMLVVCFY